MNRATILLVCCSAVAACGGTRQASPAVGQIPALPVGSPGEPTANEVAAAQHDSPITPDDAHRLIISAAACWLGGFWRDAEGVADSERAEASERGCRDVVRRAHGRDDVHRYERLRALDAAEVSDLVDRISVTPELGTLLRAIADAEREMLFARRAADRVKKDLDGVRTKSKLPADQREAVAALRPATAFDALLHLDVGELSHEAGAIAVLIAMQRVQLARGLPKQLKIYAVERPYGAIFGAPAPTVSPDPNKPLKGGEWLAYLTDAAKAAGHPVPASARSLRDRELLAWAGAMMGLADKLLGETDRVSESTELKQVAREVVQRLEIGYRAAEAATLHASAKD